ncbi:MAG: FtsX-like permease family protein [Methanomassiliicoccales archaeon]|nr:MAG: FtsX-like permease family protein [Methanomassiliicoccales archaeon]
MVSALLRKSMRDLSKRKARTMFTVLTIALAVSALGLFSVVPLMDASMEQEVEDSNMYDVRIWVSDLVLNESQMKGLEGLDNVNALEGRSVFYTRMYIGERRNDVIVIGVEDFVKQNVDIVAKDSGNIPGYMELLADRNMERANLYDSKAGDMVRIYDFEGNVQELKITGSGHSLLYSDYPMFGLAVFYADVETVHLLSNTSGMNIISFDLEKNTPQDADKAIADIEGYLVQNTDFESFTDIPDVRLNGDWPGEQNFSDMSSFFVILTLMTLFCSVFLISNTMHTMITEQKREIGQLKAIGATKLQVVKSYTTTGFMMGGTGSVIGAILGIIISYLMVSFLANNFFGITPDFNIYLPVVIISIAVGCGITLLATLPAMIKVLRMTAREGMENHGITAHYGTSKFDLALMKMKGMPRSAQMGLRNMARKKGRSASTILQITLAVGMFLAIASIGHSIQTAVSEEFDNFTCDIISAGSTEGGRPLYEDLQYVLEDIEGVEMAEPIVGTGVQVAETELSVFGYAYDTVGYDVDRTMYKGRWYDQKDQESNASVIVLTKTFSELEHIDVGDTIEVQMATGEFSFEVIGLSSTLMNNGMACFIPISTLQDKLNMGDIVTGFVIKAESGSHELIDRVATDIEDTMLERGFVVNNLILYVAEEQNHQANQQVLNLMMAVGSIIVLITLIGLMSMLTMNVIERTKEIGMMRCLGSSSRSIRSVFGVEGLVIALWGWAAGVPLGFFVGSFLNQMIYELLHLEMAFLYPMEYVFISLILTLIMTLIVIQPSLWRASHLKPGDALRYE